MQVKFSKLFWDVYRTETDDSLWVLADGADGKKYLAKYMEDGKPVKVKKKKKQESKIVNRLIKKAAVGIEDFEIFFDDLTEECQKRILLFYDASDPSEMNWETMPITVLAPPEEI